MQAKRDEIAEKSEGAVQFAKEFLDCGPCQRTNTDAVRASMDCPYLAKRWKGPRAFSDAPCCPGYLIAQPEVTETALALRWRGEGSLRDRYDRPLTDALRGAIDILDISCKEQEGAAMRRLRAEQELNRGPH